MLFWYFLVVITIIWLIFATATDIKTREVPDWLSYSLIVLGLGSRLIYSLVVWDFRYILYGFLGFGIFFGVANFMYFTKQWGGGDSKLLMGLGAMFGNYEPIFNGTYELPFLITLLINIFIAGTIYGVLYSFFLGVENWNNFVVEFKKRNFNELKIIGLLFVIIGIACFFLFDKSIFNLVVLLLLALFVGIFLLYIIKIIEDSSLYKMIEINKLTEGDWLVNDIKKGKKLICEARNIGLTKKDISSLKKNKVTRVLIKEGIPFVPGFLIGFLVSISLGDLIMLFV